MESARTHWMVTVASLGMMASTALIALADEAGPPDAGPVAEQDASAGMVSANSAVDLATADNAATRKIPRGEPPPANPAGGVTEHKASSGGGLIPRPAAGGEAGTRAVAWYRSPYVVLVPVLLLICGAWRLLRRYAPAAAGSGGRALRVVGRVALSTKQSAVLLHLGRRLVLVGVTPERLVTLSEIADPEEVSRLLGELAPGPTSADGFSRQLGSEVSKYGSIVAEGPAAIGPTAGDNTLREAKNQLQDLLGKLRALQQGRGVATPRSGN